MPSRNRASTWGGGISIECGCIVQTQIVQKVRAEIPLRVTGRAKSIASELRKAGTVRRRPRKKAECNQLTLTPQFASARSLTRSRLDRHVCLKILPTTRRAPRRWLLVKRVTTSGAKQ